MSRVAEKGVAPRPRTVRHGAQTGSGEASLPQSVQIRRTLPEQTFAGPQHLQALERANRCRRERAAERRRVAAMDRAAATRRVLELLEDPPEPLARMCVGALLLWIPRVGRTKLRRWLSGLRISELRRLEELTPRERARLAAAVRGDSWILRAGWEVTPRG